MAEKQKEMEYRFLGPTGLKVSVLGFGNYAIAQNMQKLREPYNEIMQRCWDSGINFYDTAEHYGKGQGEEALGNSLKQLNAPREDFVISTKLLYGQDIDTTKKNQVNRISLTRKHIIEGALNSLRRLQLDYVDMLFCHRYDHETPVEETVRAFNWLIEQGKTFYWGTSEWEPQAIQESFIQCNRLGLVKPIAEQCQYSLLYRNRFEVTYSDLFSKYKYGSTIWSALAVGILTGKYNHGIPSDSRIATTPSMHKLLPAWYGDYWGQDNWPKTVEKLNLLEDIAKGIGATLSQLSIAWTIANKDVSTCILGATKVSQFEKDIKSLEFVDKITPEIENQINDILGNRPQPPTNWKSFGPLPHRR